MNKSYCDIPAGTPVLVTGATGFTGAVLTRKLVEAGLSVSAVARATSNLDTLRDLPIQWFRGEVFDETVMREAMKGQAYVFHVAAAFREAKGGYQDYWNVHVKSTQIIAEEALKQPGFKRLVHVSTFGVHGHVVNPPGTEESPYAPGDDYQKTKLEAELWLREFAAKHDLNYTIMRPAAIYGPGDRRLLKLFKMATRPFFPLLGRGRCMYHLVHVDDLTNCFLIAATHPAARGEAIICGGTEPIPVAEIARIVSEHLGVTTRVIRLPIGPFFLLADVCEALCKPLKIEPPIYRRRVAFYSKDRDFDVSKMRRVLGYEPKYSNRDGLIETADWYIAQGWMKRT
ncbi:MAG TPA: NAD-dependent epimerase/dehydratase family protein [Kiritimatiellia bacterium]|nr:NAD-dependent epimerase/dehydratase family protein [Kiritimatiellia bacterium]HMO99119.1 NAD-dependent epimerase/dehydratase family protein [Kiritimatiellia bacterium]HMP95703.1 NAD-dependent epimerase/dehydratase family protein [Kiritimatiellia bacterium]